MNFVITRRQRRASSIGNRFLGIGHEFVEGCAACGRGKTEGKVRLEIEGCRLRRTARGASRRPRIQSAPRVRSGLERVHGCDVHLRRVVLEIVIEEWKQNLALKGPRRVALEA